MKELVIISGKGGTGKTSISASLAVLAKNNVIVDCDVDAADMHLVLRPDVQEEHAFKAGKEAMLHQAACMECGKCISMCRFDAISHDYIISPLNCEGCGVCAWFCPVDAIEMREKTAGYWYQSKTDHGPLFHARLNIGEDNSGKLVSLVKEKAREYAHKEKKDIVLVDGPPGTGCPVIASISGATMVLIVTEPTVTGIHDMQRVVELANHFHITPSLCINKADLNPRVSDEIKIWCREKGVPVLAEISYDKAFTDAQIEQRTVAETGDNSASKEIQNLWNKLHETISQIEDNFN